MTIQVLMPGAGAGTSHGKIIQWLKQKGDKVSAGDILAEVETDKAVIDVEAFDEGVLQEIVVEAGDVEVAAGEVIAILSNSVQDQPKDIAPTTAFPRHFASPSARRLARQADVDVTTLKGSGPGGRVVRVDVEAAATFAACVPAPTSAPSTVRPSSTPESSTHAQRIPHSTMRKTIARRLQEAKQQIPHFYLTVDCRMDAAWDMRAQINAILAGSGQRLNITINDVLVYVVARALARVPDVNVRWAADAMQQNSGVDISVAVSTDKGLVTPIVRDADRKGLVEISREVDALVDKARAGRLAPADYEGGGLTISNLGMQGIKAFAAIINPPQAAILAFGAVEKRPIVLDDALSIARVMTVTMSADHRAIDGAAAARFLAELKGLFETPYSLLA
ncbi:branched-chain alpha-keto acid dehydrogenase subunit E2 [Pollutimonas nitritireducens]|uniref:Dihydrolipoamide acetyltransferase component of pyruvate dehydrogenase complex n=1 Tax=Pollutimonas nitritireducens TaxID=2045209 RepID=A0A2N4UE72_9BURK|nr:dihydrolipoamide acetyltransferase family protein [Pollutimonas nitritireducens]PLC53312.1 branched-chain alpha-keto acid dehydrogenase subunit E2 [Pollutimonas nitritireducens]